VILKHAHNQRGYRAATPFHAGVVVLAAVAVITADLVVDADAAGIGHPQVCLTQSVYSHAPPSSLSSVPDQIQSSSVQVSVTACHWCQLHKMLASSCRNRLSTIGHHS